MAPRTEIYYPDTLQLELSDDTSFFAELCNRALNEGKVAQDLAAKIIEDGVSDRFGIDSGDTGIKLREIVCDINRKDPRDLTYMVKIEELREGIQKIIKDYRLGADQNFMKFIRRLGEYSKSRTTFLSGEGAANDMIESDGEIGEYNFQRYHAQYLGEKVSRAKSAVDILLSA